MKSKDLTPSHHMLGELRAKIEAIQNEAADRLAALKNLREFQEFKVKILGKKGSLTQILHSLGSLSPHDRPLAGRLVNEAKQAIEDRLRTIQQKLEQEGLKQVLKEKTVDVTLPGLNLPRGRRHPIRQVLEEIETIFLGMGFSIHEGPEVETDYYNFEALNFPEEHPARDMQDTFYISRQSSVVSRQEKLKTEDSRLTTFLLRTHTSPVQIRVMEKQKPPLAIIAPGTVYRHDDDVTHSPMFHQVEGLMVDTDITLADLKGVLTTFCRAVFGADREVRFRPSFFPFVEPGAEVDISCALCRKKPHHLRYAEGIGPSGQAQVVGWPHHLRYAEGIGPSGQAQVVGKGCRVCAGSGWLEILGAGMVHPAVFEHVRIDPKKYSGFAFGMGVERIAMLKYGMDDIRLFYESDVRFLEQF